MAFCVLCFHIPLQLYTDLAMKLPIPPGQPLLAAMFWPLSSGGQSDLRVTYCPTRDFGPHR
jgi:hypothetical protein